MIKLSVFRLITQAFLLTVLLFGAFFLFASPALAQTPGLEGWAWSSTIGWISMSCENLNTCAADDYAVTIDSNRNLVGYAWSSNIGWIRFGGLSNFPTTNGNGGGNARIERNAGITELNGWARACAGTAGGGCGVTMTNNPLAGGWDGWISLKGTASNGAGYGVVFNEAAVTPGQSFAWGNTVVGWVDFSGVIKNENDIDVKAFSLTGTPVADAESVYNNVRFSTSIVGIPDGATVDYTLFINGPTTKTESGTVTQSGSATQFSPELMTSGLDFGNYEFKLEIDLPAPGDVIEMDETSNNFRELKNQDFPPVAPDMSIFIVDSVPFVRVGQAAEIDWTVSAPYIANCTVEGAGMSVPPFSTSGNSADVETGPASTGLMKSTSIVTLTCTEPTTNTVFTEEVRVEVVPNVEEI